MDRYYPITFTVPANTPVAAPFSQPWPLEDNWLEYVRFIVPSGPSFAMGWRILWANQQIVPWGNLSWIVTDNDKNEISVRHDIAATGVVVQGYNTDVFPHTVYLFALMRTSPVPSVRTVTESAGPLAMPGMRGNPVVSGIDTLTAADFILSSDQAAIDASVGSDTGLPVGVAEIPPEAPTGEVPVTGVTSSVPVTVTSVLPVRSPVDLTMRGYKYVLRSRIRTHVKAH